MISKNPVKLNRCDWFILIWVVYYLQGVLYPSGGFISVGLLGVNLIVSLICALKVLQMPFNPPYIKGLNVLLLLFTIYGFAFILFNPPTIHYNASGLTVSSYGYIKQIYLSLLPIYAFYYFAVRGYLTADKLRWWAAVFCISSVVSYYYNMQLEMMKLVEKGSSAEETTNNVGYIFLSLIPIWILFNKKPLLQYAGLAICMAFILMGMKRGAIAIGGVVVLYLVWKIIRNAKGVYKFYVILLTVALGILGVYLVAELMATSDYFLQRIEETIEGDTSGRDNLYSFFWEYFSERADFVNFLFGRGANGTLEIYYNYAHNDWLEIAVNQGLIGVAVYVVYWVLFYQTWRRAINIEAKTIIALVGIIFFAKTFFSMSYGDMTYVCTSVFGYGLATMKNKNCN